MSDGRGLRLNTTDIRFGDKYDQQQMQQFMNYVNEIARLNQRIVQMLRAGTAGQVLKKIDEVDLNATWDTGGGGGIESIQPGTNVSVDNTDPANPVVSAAGEEGPQGPVGPTGPEGPPGEIPTLVEGFLIDIDATDPLNIEIAVDEAALEALLAFSGSRVYRSAGAGNQAIPGTAFTSVEFDTESYDVGGYWDISNPSRFTVPTDGIYRIDACILSIAGAPVGRELYVLVNGVTGTRYALSATDEATAALNVHASLELAAGDYVEVSCFFAAGADVSPVSELVNFEIHRLVEL